MVTRITCTSLREGGPLISPEALWRDDRAGWYALMWRYFDSVNITDRYAVRARLDLFTIVVCQVFNVNLDWGGPKGCYSPDSYIPAIEGHRDIMRQRWDWVSQTLWEGLGERLQKLSVPLEGPDTLTGPFLLWLKHRMEKDGMCLGDALTHLFILVKSFYKGERFVRGKHMAKRMSYLEIRMTPLGLIADAGNWDGKAPLYTPLHNFDEVAAVVEAGMYNE
jgi:hypothetical protein